MIYKPHYFNIDNDSKENKMHYYIAAYNDNGDYVGTRERGRYFEKRGIEPELCTPTDNCCSIGFCAQEQKWYGWSHRAISRFGIGSKVKKGDCAYVTDNVDELYESITEYTPKENVEKLNDGVKIEHKMVKLIFDENDIAIGSEPCESEYQIIKCGKGEWVAKTLDDARQMACDFAEDVS